MRHRLGFILLLTMGIGRCVQPVMATAPPALDFTDDALPDGVKARIGSGRLRHADAVTALACSPDGKCLASHCRWENFVSVWETDSGKLRARLPVAGVAKMAFTTDGSKLAVILATSAFTGEILVECWDVATSKRLSRFRDEERYAEDAVLEFSPDGKHLFFGRSALHRLDWAGGQLDYQVPMAQNAITALALTADGTTLVSAEGDGSVRLRDATTGRERCRAFGGEIVSRLAVAPEGNLLAVGNTKGLIEIWQIPHHAKQEPGVTFTKRTLPVKDVGGLSGLTFARDGKRLFSLSIQGKACLWDVVDGECLLRRQLPARALGAAVIDATQQPLAVMADNYGLSIWNVAAGEELFTERRIGRCTCLTFSPDGNTVVTGSDDQALRFWHAGKGVLLATVKLLGVPSQADFSADGKNLVAGGAGLWWNVSVDIQAAKDAASVGRVVAKLLGAPDLDSMWHRARDHVGRSLPWKIELIDECMLTPDGLRVSLKRDKVQVFEAGNGRKLCELDGTKFSGAALAHNRRALAAVQNELTVTVAEVASGQEVDRWDLDRQEVVRGQPWLVPRIAFVPGGRLLAAGTPRGSILFWDLATSTQVHKLEGHHVPVATFAFAPDGRTLACAYRDTTILIWDLAQLVPKSLAGPPQPPPPLDENWLKLESAEAPMAWKAHWALVQGSKQTVTYLKERLKPVGPVELRQAGPLIKQLDNPVYAVRQGATKELELMGQAAETELRQALKNAANLEVSRRLQGLLAKVEAAQRRQVQELRAIAVLEQIATAEAMALLETLATGDPQAPVTLAAQAARKRGGRMKNEE